MSRDALVVGINTYEYLPKLNAPAEDAEAIAQSLQNYGDFRVWRLPEFLNPFDNNARQVAQNEIVTLKQLEDALINLFLPEGKHVPDTALFYFSGHGLRKERGIQEGFLATSHANPQEGNWGISLKWLRELLQKSSVRQQIIWLDCCYSGELLNFSEPDPGDRGKGRDLCFIAASREFEVAYEETATLHSVVTKAILEGLDPTRYPGRWVTNYTLVDFLNQQLLAATQRPVFTNFGEPINLTCRWETPTIKSTVASEQAICPYKGLAYFDCNDEDPKYFYGRTALTDRLLNRVRQSNFLAIVGASGSGKSSVLRAGLLHQLKLGRKVSGSDQWQIHIMQPGEQPLQNLAFAFLDPNLSAIERAKQLGVAEELIAQGATGLRRLVQSTPTNRVVLVIDQFEEVFTLCREQVERQRFFECILGALAQTVEAKHTASLLVIIAMRADFFGKCLEQDYSGLSQQIQQHLVTVTPMDREELREAIVKPAQQVALEIEPELVAQMLADVADSPGSLPLMQYTLMELWKQKTDGYLRLNTYAKLGGVMGTLQERATAVYEQLPEEQKPIIQHIFLALTQLGEGTEDTRRRVLKRNLVTSRHSEALIDEVLKELADEKLVVTGELVEKGQELSRVVVVDVVHEALIRYWPLLRRWIDQNRDNLRQQRKIEAAAEEWQDNGRAKDYLFRGTRLAEANNFKEKYRDEFTLSSLAIDFIENSEANPSEVSIGSLNISGSSVGSNFNEVNIEQANFSELNLTDSSFAETSINEANFSELNLTGSSFAETSINEANFSEVNLTGSSFAETSINEARFSAVELPGSAFTQTNIDEANFLEVNLTGAIFTQANINEANFSNVNLTGAAFVHVIFNQAYIKDSELMGIELVGATFIDSSVGESILSTININIQVNLSGSDLSRADLRGGDLRGGNLREAKLCEANLSGINLSGTDLSGSDLSKANLSGAKLLGSNLSRANLNGANLTDANLRGADLANTNLIGTQNLSPEQVKAAQNWEQAIYDEEFQQQLALRQE